MKALVLLAALLIPFAGMTKDKSVGPAHVPIGAYTAKTVNYTVLNSSLHSVFDFTAPYLLHSIELRLGRRESETTECEGSLFLEDQATQALTYLVKTTWRTDGDTSPLYLKFPTAVLIDPQKQILALGVDTSGGFCIVTFNGITSAP